MEMPCQDTQVNLLFYQHAPSNSKRKNIQPGLLGNISYEKKLNNLGVIYPKEETSEQGYDISLQIHKRLMKRGEAQSVPPVQGAQEKTQRASVATGNKI